MRVVRRFLLWICKLALLSCVSVPVYMYVRNSPRCTVDGIVGLGGLSTDGRTLLVNDFSAQWRQEGAAAQRGERKEPEQIRLYDTHSGRVSQSFDQIIDHAASPDGQHHALQTGRDTVVLDLVACSHWTLHDSDRPVFSSTGKWLRVRQKELPALVCVKSGRIACRLSSDSQTFYCDDRYVSETRDDRDFELIEVATGESKRLPVSKLDFPAYGEIAASRDGRWFAFGEVHRVNFSGGPGPFWEPSTSKQFEKCEIWDWHDRKRIASLGQKREPWTLQFSDDNRRVAVWREGKEVSDLKILHLDGRAEADVAFPAGFFAPKTPNHAQQSSSCSGHFSRNSAHFALDHSFNDGQRMAMIETGTGRVLWTKANWEFACFGPGGTCLLDERDELRNRNLRVVDTKSGAVLAHIDANLHVVYDQMDSSFDDNQTCIILSSLGAQWRDPEPLEKWLQKYLPWTHLGKSPGLAVVDLATGHERSRLVHSAPQFILSGDGSTLATCRSCNGDDGNLAFWRVEVWDLRPHRALFWSLAISIAMGIFALLLRRVFKRKRAPHP